MKKYYELMDEYQDEYQHYEKMKKKKSNKHTAMQDRKIQALRKEKKQRQDFNAY